MSNKKQETRNMEFRRLFVCTNQKSRVGEDVADALKKELKNRRKQLPKGSEKPNVRVQTCNCLDLCKQCKKGSGAAVIGYPEGAVYGHVRPADATQILDHYLSAAYNAAWFQP